MIFNDFDNVHVLQRSPPTHFGNNFFGGYIDVKGILFHTSDIIAKDKYEN